MILPFGSTLQRKPRRPPSQARVGIEEGDGTGEGATRCEANAEYNTRRRTGQPACVQQAANKEHGVPATAETGPARSRGEVCPEQKSNDAA